MKFKLGSLAKDEITGFTGTVTGCVKYLTGCDQYLLAPKIDKEGKHVEARWYDENRIKEVKAVKVMIDTSKSNGACESAPIK